MLNCSIGNIFIHLVILMLLYPEIFQIIQYAFSRHTMVTEEHERQESVRTVSPVALPLPARAAQLPPPERPPRPAVYSQVRREKQVRWFSTIWSWFLTWV